MASQNKVVVPEDVKAAVRQWRTIAEGKGDLNQRFIVLGYTDAVTLTVVAEGNGGLEEASEHMPNNECRYALLRRDHTVEISKTVKFAYVDWTPTGIKPTRKAILSTHKGQVSDSLKPFHVSIQASDRSDLDEKEIANQIAYASGTANLVTTKAATTELWAGGRLEQDAPTKPRGADLVPDSIRNERKLNVANNDDLKAAIAAVRANSDPLNWLLVGYRDVDTLEMIGSGNGGVAELCERLDDNHAFYAFFRVEQKFDNSVTVKFGFLKLLPPKLPAIQKAKMSTHRGFVTKLFEPYHVEFDVLSKDDFSFDIVMEKIGKYTGTNSNVRTDAEAKALQKRPTTGGPSTTSSSGPQVSQAANAIHFVDEKAIREAIRDVRSDRSPTTWMLVSYAHKHTLELLSTGTGGVDEVIAAIEEKRCNFGLFRVTDQIDNSATVKFVFVACQVASQKPSEKGQMSVIKGAIDELFSPFHVDFRIASSSELSEAIVMEKVSAASGSKRR